MNDWNHIAATYERMLRQFYYTKDPKDSLRNVARVILSGHRLVSFPLELDGSDY